MLAAGWCSSWRGSCGPSRRRRLPTHRTCRRSARQRSPGADGPQVVIDEAHYNLHTVSGTYAPFADLLRRDGFWVRRNVGPLSAAALHDSYASRFDSRVVLVVSNALGWRGMLQQALNAGGLERLVRVQGAAISAEEVAEIEAWVRAGGSLLLVADHAPAGAAAAGLSAAFGVEMTNWWAEDEKRITTPRRRTPGSSCSRATAGLLGDHPIMLGRSPGEQVHRVMTFTGQALRPGAGAALLTLSSTAREYPFRQSREVRGAFGGRAGAGRCARTRGRPGRHSRRSGDDYRPDDPVARRHPPSVRHEPRRHRQPPVRAERHALAHRVAVTAGHGDGGGNGLTQRRSNGVRTEKNSRSMMSSPFSPSPPFSAWKMA